MRLSASLLRLNKIPQWHTEIKSNGSQNVEETNFSQLIQKLSRYFISRKVCNHKYL